MTLDCGVYGAKRCTGMQSCKAYMETGAYYPPLYDCIALIVVVWRRSNSR
jgi:hypothetical protein